MIACLGKKMTGAVSSPVSRQHLAINRTVGEGLVSFAAARAVVTGRGALRDSTPARAAAKETREGWEQPSIPKLFTITVKSPAR